MECLMECQECNDNIASILTKRSILKQANCEQWSVLIVHKLPSTHYSNIMPKDVILIILN